MQGCASGTLPGSPKMSGRPAGFSRASCLHWTGLGKIHCPICSPVSMKQIAISSQEDKSVALDAQPSRHLEGVRSFATHRICLLMTTSCLSNKLLGRARETIRTQEAFLQPRVCLRHFKNTAREPHFSSHGVRNRRHVLKPNYFDVPGHPASNNVYWYLYSSPICKYP